MSLITDLFGRSPVRPMQQHMAVAVSCAREMVPLFEAMATGDTERIPTLRARVDELEHEADRIKNEIRGHLPKRLFMAFERRDMLEILHSQDSIADTAQDIAELVDQRAMVLPSALRDSVIELVRRSIAACEQAERIVNELDELVETGFQGREVGRVEEMIGELNRLESDSDDLHDRATRELFAAEAELGVATFFWWELLRWVADLADHAEKVGNRLRLLIAV
jgi:predicted phosphate transport protein (TIGR00153 family)